MNDSEQSDQTIQRKSCTKCLEEKSTTDFYKSKKGKYGVDSCCKKCRNSDRQEWVESDPERFSAYNKKRYLENREAMLDSNKAWRRSNPKRNAERMARWQKRNPHLVNQGNHRRRARVSGAVGSFSEQEWYDLCEQYDNKCLCCGVPDARLTQDHVVPLSKGGSNGIENIQPLCGPCNSSKGTKTIDYRS